MDVEEGCQAILYYLEKQGYLTLPNSLSAAPVEERQTAPRVEAELVSAKG